MINVLTIYGKHESVDHVMLKQFETVEEAQQYVDETNARSCEKYYAAATIVENDKKYSMHGSDGDEPAEIY